MENQSLGSAFQDLTAAIARTLANDERFTITSPMRLRDNETGRLREHDIVITFRLGRHDSLTALDCRERSRRVGAPTLDAFYKKCERTGVHRGIVISEQGFTAAALRRAAELGLGCMSVETAAQFDWRQTQSVKHHNRLITSIQAVVTTDPPFSGRVKVCDLQGRPIDRKRLHGFVVACLDATSGADTWTPGVFRQRFHQINPDLRAETPDGTPLNVSRVDLDVAYQVSEAAGPVDFHSYKNEHAADHGASLAAAPMDLDGAEGRFSSVRGADGRLTISLQLPTKER